MNSRPSASGNSSLHNGKSLFRRLLAAFLGLAGAWTVSAQSNYSTPYTISTLAGAGFVFAGYLDGTGTGAQFNAPYGVAADASGNVYIADSSNYVIRKITSGGVVTTLAGHAGLPGTLDGTGTGAQFGAIRGIALDGSGNLYVTDYTYGTVRKVVIASGAVTTFVPASAGLSQPVGIAVDPTSGNIYVADAGNYVIRKVASGGSVSIFAGSAGHSGGTDGSGSGAQFSYPTGVAVDSGGNVYVADYQGNTVRKITSAGSVTTFAGVFGNPGVVDGPVSGAVLDHPYGVAIDSAGDIFMTDSANLIREISGSTVSTLAGQQSQPGALNGTGSNAWFNTPAGIAVTSVATTIYVADTINNMIRKGVPYNTAQPPQIMNQPQSVVNTVVGGLVILQVTATPPNGVSYQWQWNGGSLSDTGNYSGTHTSTLTISNMAANQGGNYTVIVTSTSGAGSVTSNPSVVTVTGAGSPPSITTQPASQAVNAGANVTLGVTATGATNYQWQFNGAAIAGATNATLSLPNIGTAQAGSYTVVVSNGTGPVTSNAAIITVNGAGSPSFSLQPVSQTIANGTTVVFSALASGTPAPAYQWSVNGTPISGATNQQLVISSATAVNAGNYTCVASNSAGSATSGAATLAAISTGNPGRLVNLSVNAAMGGGQILTVGFYNGGGGTSGSQTLLVQTLGPVLANFGVTSFMPDPQLNIINAAGAVIAANAGWGTPASNQLAVMTADAATGATALSNTSSKDSAAVLPLSAGGYSVQVSSVSGTSGTVVAALYDDTTTYTAATPRLINISCQFRMGANGVLTPGFWVGGTTSKTVLIRANGPALAAFGITGVMPDPQLSLHTTVNGTDTILASNAGWGGSPVLASIANSVGAQPYTDPNSKDSALVLTLPPGGYTAQVSSVSNTAGDTLVEVYEVP